MMNNFIKCTARNIKLSSFNLNTNILTSSYKIPTSFMTLNSIKYNFSRIELTRHLQNYLQKLNKEESLRSITEQKNENSSSSKSIQQQIVTNFLQLTEESFCDYFLQEGMKNLDSSILLMICSSMQSSQIVSKLLPKIYPFMSTFQKTELLLLFQLVLAHQIKQKPVIPNSLSLEQIQMILVILAQVYPAANILDWVKQIPLYKGENIYPIQVGLFTFIQKIDKTILARNTKLIKKCYSTIKNILIDAQDELKISSIILAFDSELTAPFAQQLIIDLEIDLQKLDPFKLQLILIATQKYAFRTYNHIKTTKQQKKMKYEIIKEQQFQYENYEEQPQDTGVLKKDFQLLDQQQKLQRLELFMKKTIKILINFDWMEIIKLNMLIQYWKLFQTFQDRHIWTQFKSKVIKHTKQQKNFKSLMSLTNNQIMIILLALQKQRLNKPQLLKSLLIILSERLSTIEKQNLIKLSKVLVTYVRQCQDYLIQVRKMIEQRLFVFSKQQIQELNQIYRRVQILFPRPLAK